MSEFGLFFNDELACSLPAILVIGLVVVNLVARLLYLVLLLLELLEQLSIVCKSIRERSLADDPPIRAHVNDKLIPAADDDVREEERAYLKLDSPLVKGVRRARVIRPDT